MSDENHVNDVVFEDSDDKYRNDMPLKKKENNSSNKQESLQTQEKEYSKFVHEIKADKVQPLHAEGAEQCGEDMKKHQLQSSKVNGREDRSTVEQVLDPRTKMTKAKSDGTHNLHYANSVGMKGDLTGAKVDLNIPSSVEEGDIEMNTHSSYEDSSNENANCDSEHTEYKTKKELRKEHKQRVKEENREKRERKVSKKVKKRKAKLIKKKRKETGSK